MTYQIHPPAAAARQAYARPASGAAAPKAAARLQDRRQSMIQHTPPLDPARDEDRIALEHLIAGMLSGHAKDPQTLALRRALTAWVFDQN